MGINFSKFKIKKILLKNLIFSFCHIVNLDSKLTKDEFSWLSQELSELTKKSWGEFGADFIEEHVLNSKFLVLAMFNGSVVGYGAVSEKFFLAKKYCYFEFLIIDPEYQKIGLSREIIKILIKNIFFHNFLKFKFFLDFITITPNPRIIGMISRQAIEMYPDPKYFINNKILEPSEYIFNLASEVIKQSYNPNRRIDKIGLILHNSYDLSPWLIYNNDSIPWDLDDNVNIFCRHYLEYDKMSGNEFIVIAKIKLFNFFK